jgi:hypothetical protein
MAANKEKIQAAMADDSLSELVELSELNGDCDTIVEICRSCCSNKEDDLEAEMEEGLDALLRLSSSATQSRLDALQAANVCPMIPEAMTKYQDEASIVEVLFGLVRNLSKGDTALRTILGNNVNAALIISCMNTHAEGEATLQEMGCLVIEGLCTDHAANIESFKLADATTCVTDVATPAITNERHLTYPGRALKAMGIHL